MPPLHYPERVKHLLSMIFWSHLGGYHTRAVRRPVEGGISVFGSNASFRACPITSASLIGHSRSSAFRPSPTYCMSMSLTGSCFSSESAPRPFHHGIRGRGGTICSAALPSNRRWVQADMRTHLIHRPARDIIPPLGGARVSSSALILRNPHAAKAPLVQRNSVPSTQMRWRITASRRARATIAFFIPRRLAICIAQALSQDHFFERSML